LTIPAPASRPNQQNQFGFTFGGPLVRNRTFFFVDYEGLRIRQSQTLTSTVPTLPQRSGDFSSQLDLSSPQQVLAADGTTMIPASDCAGHPTYAGEIFDTRHTQANGAYLSGLLDLNSSTGRATSSPWQRRLAVAASSSSLDRRSRRSPGPMSWLLLISCHSYFSAELKARP